MLIEIKSGHHIDGDESRSATTSHDHQTPHSLHWSHGWWPWYKLRVQTAGVNPPARYDHIWVVNV